MFNQHAKWLKTTNRHRLAAAHPVAQLPAVLARLAPGPQRLLPPGPGLHRPGGQQEGRGHPGLPAPRRQLPAVGGRPLPAQPPVRERDRGRQAAGAPVPVDGRGGLALHARPGIWEWASNDDGDPDVVLACAGDIPTLETLAATALLREHLPELRVRVINVVDLMRLQPAVRAPPRAPRPGVRRPVHHRPAGDLRLPRLPVADPPPHLPAHQPRRPARARVQGGGHHHHAVRHGHAATTWTASTWSWT